MKKVSRICCMLMAIMLACLSSFAHPIDVNAATKKEILFIGNSKTASYGSPAKSFELLAKANSKSVNVTICAKGGKTLKELASMPEYVALMKAKKYDIVIMQEGIYPYLGFTQEDYNNYYAGVTKIAEIVRQKNPKVDLYLRQVWVGKEFGTVKQISGGGQASGKFYYRQYDTCTTQDKQRAYKNTVTIANAVKAEVIYDGYVMGSYNNRYITKGDVLFQDDNYHQTELGSALVATAIYTSIYNSQPRVLNTDTFTRKSQKVVNVVTGKNYKQSSFESTLTSAQINRIRTVIKAKYGY